MKAIILIHRDGRHMAFTVSVDFDTQAWAQTRLKAFALLGVVGIEERVS